MHDDGYFGERVAATYDADEAMADPEIVDPVADLLAELADGGRALEFAIGTGRIALPLSRRGVMVEGIELSSAMVTQLRGKQGGEEIPVVIGDMATARTGGRFSLVYLVFNTIMNLTSQDAQVTCFANAAAHLEPGGRFLVEVLVPPLQRLPVGQTHLAFLRGEAHWGMDEIDVVRQALTSHHIRRRGEAFEATSIPFRYVWPAELDLMARLAGMTLEHRWGGWPKEPFTALSRSHVSVWRKPA